MLEQYLVLKLVAQLGRMKVAQKVALKVDWKEWNLAASLAIELAESMVEVMDVQTAEKMDTR
jgi:hypothetical protein